MDQTNPVGRPTLYTKQLGAFICARVGAGESLRRICSDAAMPAAATVSRWLNDEDKPEFREQYRMAYEANLMVEAYSMREMVDEVEPTMVAIAKVREQIAHRKWELAIQFPKRYGPKPEPVVLTSTGEDLAKLTKEELDAYVALLTKMKKDD